jgi:hypothetical protein
MKRLVVAACIAVAGLGGAIGAGHGIARADSGGNSAAAHACQQGGYANLIGTNGTTDTTFSNTGQCVSYAAQGGTLVSKTAAAPCLSGGYANLAPGQGSPAFSSEAACVLFVGQGGKPVTSQFVLTSPVNIPASAGLCWSGATNVVPSGQVLYNSGTGQYPKAVLCFQTDGNLVIYQAGHVGDPAYAVFQTHSYGHPNAVLAFQGDGNLVIYDGNTALWNSQTYGHPGDCAVFQGDGSLDIYSSCTTS